jgi:hypothetical protein
MTRFQPKRSLPRCEKFRSRHMPLRNPHPYIEFTLVGHIGRMNGTSEGSSMLFEYFACEWVARKRCVDIEMDLPPFLAPLTGPSVARAFGWRNEDQPRQICGQGRSSDR